MDRLVLSDAAGERMAPLIIGRPDQKGSIGRDNRMFVEGGSRVRALPGAIFRRRSGIGQRVPALQSMEYQRRLVAHLQGYVR
jgi:putative transposase